MNEFIAKVQPRNTVILARNYAIDEHTDKYVGVREVFTSHIPWQPQPKSVLDTLVALTFDLHLIIVFEYKFLVIQTRAIQAFGKS